MEGKMKKIILIATISLSCVVTVWAQEDGGQAGNFLRFGVGGRALGMGRSFVSIADDASGVYWNPAGIVGTKRLEFASMYSDLYFDNQFTHFGVVVPRIGKNVRDKVGRFLIGPATALGFGWIGLSSTGYEQRTHTGEYLGDFGIGENAFLLAWAREEVGSWGIFRYGFNLKFVNQNFSGLESSPSAQIGWENRDWSTGMDLGFTFQPIHAPLFEVIPLRYLLPLRLGMVFQNVMQPGWRVGEKARDHFPQILRCGISYRWVFRDWIPSGWISLRRFVGNAQILTSFDAEFYEGTNNGAYFGMEGYFPISRSGFVFSPRAGFNNRYEGTALGCGLTMPITSSTLLRIDYAYGFHPDLPEDSRFFITLQMGREMGAGYFMDVSRERDTNDRETRNHLLRVLAEYPNEFVFDAVENLTVLEDSSKIRRYYGLSGGVGRADWLFHEAKSFLKAGKIGDAQKKANDAVREYIPILAESSQSMNNEKLLNLCESYIMAGRIQDAVSILETNEVPTLRGYFLLGTCKKALGDWDGAIEVFRNAMKRYEVEQDLNSMVYLSFMGLGEALIKSGQFETAITTLGVVLANKTNRLESNYPRYPIYWDGYIVDDAQFLIGLCTLLMNQTDEGVAELLKTQRLFPNLEYGRFVEERADELIEAIDVSDWAKINNLTQQFLVYYFEKHDLPPR